MASGDLKSFYRQRKPALSSTTKPTKSPKSTLAQPPTLISHGSLDLKDDYGAEEEVLRQFDLDMRYGPCLGITRMERWYRAARIGLEPPTQVRDLLVNVEKIRAESLFDGRV